VVGASNAEFSLPDIEAETSAFSSFISRLITYKRTQFPDAAFPVF
jgi:hypothetical protein